MRCLFGFLAVLVSIAIIGMAMSSDITRECATKGEMLLLNGVTIKCEVVRSHE